MTVDSARGCTRLVTPPKVRRPGLLSEPRSGGFGGGFWFGGSAKVSGGRGFARDRSRCKGPVRFV